MHTSVFTVHECIRTRVEYKSNSFRNNRRNTIIKTNSMLNFRVTRIRTLIIRSVISFNSQRRNQMHRIRTFTHLLTKVRRTTTRRMSRTNIIPYKIRVTRRRMRVIMVLRLNRQIRAAIPRALITKTQQRQISKTRTRLTTTRVSHHNKGTT